MKAHQNKNLIKWLIILIIIVSAIVFYRVGFHIPVPAFNGEKVESLQGHDSQEVQTPPKEEQSDAPPESAFQPRQTVELTMEKLKDRQAFSENPLYFCIVFGEEGNDSMLGILDETGGTGTGYNVAYIDENMNGNLTDEAAKEFPRYERGSRAGELDPRVEFTGPFKNGQKAKYTLYIYSLTRKTHRKVPGNDYPFHWFLEVNQWNYFFINGKMTPFSNSADAQNGKPVRLAGSCHWEINARTRNGKPMISAGLKDQNGCTLRSVRLASKRLSPTLTLIQDGQNKAEEKMTFG